jgi:hypothetical protein
MFLSYVMLIVALCLSAVAAFYSIVGLTAIFAAAVIPIIVMGSILEIAKVTVTIWLHEYWTQCRLAMKAYLVPAVCLLMVITSMGIFGFLSKAHSDQSLVSGDSQAKISIYDEKIRTARDNIETNRRALKQMDEAVDQLMGRSDDERGAERAVQIRRSQQKERTRLLSEIAAEQKTIAQLNEEAAPLRAENRKIEAEVGPIKYIAALIYGDNPDQNILERAVRWVIIIIVAVFDPLAIMMLLAATESMKWERQARANAVMVVPVETPPPSPTPEEIKEPDPEPEPEPWPFPMERPVEGDAKLALDEAARAEQANQILSELDPPEPVIEVVQAEPEPVLEIKEEQLVKDTEEIISETPVASWQQPVVEDLEKAAMREWKSTHPESTIKEQRRLVEIGAIPEVPWASMIALAADNEPLSGNVSGFGIAFPENASKGDVYLRVDMLPTVLYKYNGKKWIEVDKDLSDSYAYDDAYIDFLIAKLESGEYDAEMLTYSEREQIAARLQKT